ncbi:hypothetical protein [Haloarcula saliterrae]|nr:hypothetical protein [Haloarcula sp. S1CR25-12]
MQIEIATTDDDASAPVSAGYCCCCTEECEDLWYCEPDDDLT